LRTSATSLQGGVERLMDRFPCIAGVKVAGLRDSADLCAHDKATRLLTCATAFCRERDEIFAFAVPDLVFSAGALASSYRLHRFTGKTVALFNGRIASDLTDAQLLAEAAGRLDWTFFRCMNPQWRSNRTTQLGRLCGTLPGHLIIDEPGRPRSIFCSCPNPFLGRFTAADVAELGHSFSAWDHEWRVMLEREGRLIVQTALDVAMSVEIETRPKLGIRADDVPIATKFAAPTYLFTSA
jgi:hypothetical protein